MIQVILGLFIPVIGTTLGSSMVFFMKKTIPNKIEKILLGFAAGVMIAASIWSLLIPSIELAKTQKIISWFPATIGFFIGIISLILLHKVTSKIINLKNKSTNLEKKLMMILAVTLHNIPEGMAVGIIFAGILANSTLITLAGAYTLSIGIAIQNFPEGAIISVPLYSQKISKKKAFYYGTLSGIVEPIGGIITILLTNIITKLLPYLLSFAAGAMIYVVVSELIPESQKENNANYGLIALTIGFLLMMILDVSFA